MRIKKTFTLRTFLFVFTATVVLFGTVMKPVHEYRREQHIVRTLPETIRINNPMVFC